MDKAILVQYADMQEEIKDIRRRIEKTKKRLKKINSEGTVIDSVTGTRKDGTIGHIKIEGFPYPEYERNSARLNLYISQLCHVEGELLELTNQAEEYISSIEDSRMRRIIQYRVIDSLSWYEVADKIGGKATSESCRKYFDRFLEKL
ncbi:MAG: hypothetical protein LKJ25_04395 [Clostridia bacterium]|nr:hypothetical protein [Clostridia bacterium]